MSTYLRLAEVLCQHPEDIANTSLTTNGVRVNDTATYSCLPGFKLEAGNLTKVCGDDGLWQNEDPKCTGETIYIRLYTLIHVRTHNVHVHTHTHAYTYT